MTDVPPGEDYLPRRARRPRRASRTPLYILLGVIAVLVIIGLFFVGLALPGLFGGSSPTPSPTPTQTPTPTPTPTGPPTGPVAPGTYAWDELGGGECLSGYTSPWAEDFTVVACTDPHNAQLVRRGQLDGVIGSPYPGQDAINQQMPLLCQDPSVLNISEADKYMWMQWQAAYPANVDDWNAGNRSYFCFFSRSSGENIPTSIVVTPQK